MMKTTAFAIRMLALSFVCCNAVYAQTMGSITLETFDAVNKPFPSDYKVLDINGKIVSGHLKTDQKASFTPGIYTVIPLFDPSITKVVSVKAGETMAVKIRSEKMLVMSFLAHGATNRQWSETSHALEFKEQTALRRMLATLARPLPELVAARRAGVSKEQMDEALALARAELPELLTHYQRNVLGFSMSGYEERLRWNNALSWAKQIFAVSGEQSDAKWLIELASTNLNFILKKELLKLAAYVENRLGILHKGAVISVLKAKDRYLAFEAALLLHQYGISDGDSILLASLKKAGGSYDTKLAAYALLDKNDHAVFEAMRSLVRKFAAQRELAESSGNKNAGKSPGNLQPAALPAALYLIAYGDRSDWRLAAQVPIQEIEVLADLLNDLRPIVDFYLGLNEGHDQFIQYAYKVSKLCTSADRLAPEGLVRFDSYAEEALIRLAIRNNVSASGLPDVNANHARWRYGVLKGRCWASSTAANLTYNQWDQWLTLADWIPRPWDEDRLVRAFSSGNPNNMKLVEYAPHYKLEKSIKGRGSDGVVKYPELFLAYHKIGTRACEPQKCAFVLRNPKQPSTALSSVVAVNPVLVGNRLRIELIMDIATYTHVEFADVIAQRGGDFFKEIMRTHGKALIGDIYLGKGDRKLTLTDAGAGEGSGLVYEALISRRDLGDMTLHIELEFFGQKWPLDFPLYTGRYALDLH